MFGYELTINTGSINASYETYFSLSANNCNDNNDKHQDVGALMVGAFSAQLLF